MYILNALVAALDGTEAVTPIAIVTVAVVAFLEQRDSLTVTTRGIRQHQARLVDASKLVMLAREHGGDVGADLAVVVELGVVIVTHQPALIERVARRESMTHLMGKGVPRVRSIP